MIRIAILFDSLSRYLIVSTQSLREELEVVKFSFIYTYVDDFFETDSFGD